MSNEISITVEVHGQYNQTIKPLEGYTKEYVLAQLAKGVLFSGLGFSEGDVGAKLWDSDAGEYVAEVIDQDAEDADVSIISIEGQERGN